jgi:hypothetical protein
MAVLTKIQTNSVTKYTHGTDLIAVALLKHLPLLKAMNLMLYYQKHKTQSLERYLAVV